MAWGLFFIIHTSWALGFKLGGLWLMAQAFWSTLGVDSHVRSCLFFVLNYGDRRLQYNTIQYSTVQYNTIQYSTVQYSTIQYNTIQYNTIQYNTIQYHTIPYHTIQYNTIPYNTTPYNTIPYHTIPYHTLPYHTIHTCLSTAKGQQEKRIRGLAQKRTEPRLLLLVLLFSFSFFLLDCLETPAGCAERAGKGLCVSHCAAGVYGLSDDQSSSSSSRSLWLCGV